MQRSLHKHTKLSNHQQHSHRKSTDAFSTALVNLRTLFTRQHTKVPHKEHISNSSRHTSRVLDSESVKVRGIVFDRLARAGLLVAAKYVYHKRKTNVCRKH